MSLPYKKQLIAYAKQLRKGATPEEKHLWYDFLREYPVRFQRQKVIDTYIVDFYCHQAGLIVEVNGAQHFSSESIEYDAHRTVTLQSMGLTVLRITNHDLNMRFEAACKQIDAAVNQGMLKKQEQKEVSQ